MSDIKYFTTTKKGDIPELKEELLSSDKKRKTTAMKKIVANMTMGNDMSSLFPEVLACMQTPSLDLKKMVYLYLVSYAKAKQDMALLTVNSFIRDTEDLNPLIRGLAIRTMSYIEVDKISEAMAGPLRKCLKDSDPYVRKTAVLCVGKLFKHEDKMVEEEGFIDTLKDMMGDSNTTVVANVLAILSEIEITSEEGIGLTFDFSTVMKFLTALNESSEWGQVYIMEALNLYLPRDSNEAETIAERVAPRLNHANSAVIFSAIKLIMHCMPLFPSDAITSGFVKKISSSLITLLRSKVSEIQYVALRNSLLLMQKIPDLFSKEMKVFFCEYNDPIYVKLAKLEILMRIANDSNVEQILSELKEYSSEIDVDFVRKSVRAIGICAVKIERASDRCIEVLLELIQTKVNYVVQEAIVVIKNIFRKYPNRYESIIGTLCENLDTLDEPDAKGSMIWIIGQYADRIDNADELLTFFLDSFLEEAFEVQLSILTSVVKLFLHKPSQAQEMIKKMFKWATENTDNPDLRDRAFIYWRLLSTDPAGAKAVVLSDKNISIEGAVEQLEPNILNELMAHIGSLASIYHKPPSSFLDVKTKVLPELPQKDLGTAPKKQASEVKAGPTSTQMQIMGNDDYMGISMGAGTQASVGGGVGNVMNLLDLDLDEPAAEPGSSMDDVLDSLGGGRGGAQGMGMGMGGAQGHGGGLSDLMGGLDLTSGSGAGGNLFSLSLEQSLVLPKQVLLPAKSGQGLEIQGTFARRSGKIFLDLTFSNRAMQPMSDFAFQFNKNSFGITPGGPLEVRSPLMPGSSAETSLPLVLSPQQRAIKEPYNLLQIAVKNNVSVFYFQVLAHLHILFPEDGAVERSDYLRMWREIPETNERQFPISGISFPSIEAVRNKLSLNNIFAVAERQVDDRTMLYCSASVLPDRVVFLIELSFEPSFQSCNCAIKCYNLEFISQFQEAVVAVLRSQS